MGNKLIKFLACSIACYLGLVFWVDFATNKVIYTQWYINQAGDNPFTMVLFTVMGIIHGLGSFVSIVAFPVLTAEMLNRYKKEIGK